MLHSQPWKTVNTNRLNEPVKSAGEWQLLVEALNSKKQLIGRSKIKSVIVVKRPLLKGPMYTKEMPRPLLTNQRGALDIQWEKVSGATQYHVQVTDESGAVVENQTAKANQISFGGLTPGKYRVSIKTVDKFDRAGPAGESRELLVPDESNIAAPVIKNIKIK